MSQRGRQHAVRPTAQAGSNCAPHAELAPARKLLGGLQVLISCGDAVLGREIKSKGQCSQTNKRAVVFLAADADDPVRVNLSQGLGVGLGKEVFQPGGRVQHLVAGGLVARLPSAAWLRRQSSRVPSACVHENTNHIMHDVTPFDCRATGSKNGATFGGR